MELHGHRGARGLWPENTLPGFLGALSLGVSAIEMDVALTADGVVVLSHDPFLDPALTRGPDGAWIEPPGALLRSLSADEVSRFDVGRIRPDTPQARSFPVQAGQDGLRLPRLEEVVALDPSVLLAIELKTFPGHPDWTAPPETMADAVLAVLDRAGAASRTRVISFDWRGLRYLRRGAAGAQPRLPYGCGDGGGGSALVGWRFARGLRRFGAARRRSGMWHGVGAGFLDSHAVRG